MAGGSPRYAQHRLQSDGQLPDVKSSIDAQAREQSEADESPTLAEGRTHRGNTNMGGIVVATGKVSAALTNDVPRDIVAVAAADRRDPLAMIEHGLQSFTSCIGSDWSAPELITSMASTPSAPRECSSVTGLNSRGSNGWKPA
jgi:hypothetical protein